MKSSLAWLKPNLREDDALGQVKQMQDRDVDGRFVSNHVLQRCSLKICGLMPGDAPTFRCCVQVSYGTKPHVIRGEVCPDVIASAPVSTLHPFNQI